MILIQQTTQLNAEKALANLAGKLDAATLHGISTEELQELIRPAGFYRQKSVYIKNLIEWFVAHGADIAAFAAVPTDELREELLSLKGIGQETADAMLLYIFERKVFIADRYAIRLFGRLGLGNYNSYRRMREECMPLVEGVSVKTCQEWHAVIDEHGKAFRRGNIDESWLLE